MKNKKQIHILDTTLRDGQQSPGAGMSFADNIEYAQIANRLQIDILEAGFPAASSTDFAIVNQISRDMASINSPMKIAGLSQMREEQLIKTMEALAPSLAINKARVHVYVPVDPNLMQASIGNLANDKAAVIKIAEKLVQLAVNSGYEVEFSPEGYSRLGENFDFVSDLIRSVIASGATIINCPDTIGGASRHQGKEYFINKMVRHKAIMDKEFADKKIIWSMHCHNDFGLALENSLNGVFAGIATQIEGCINGVGERAGNAAIEQCVMAIRTFGVSANPHEEHYTNIDIKYLQEASDFIANKMLPRQPHTPIVGQNAATHTSGGHTNAIIKNPLSYQPFNPSDIGGEISFVFSALSGSNHAKEIIARFGYKCDDNEKTIITQYIKDYYHDRRKGIIDEELIIAYKKYRAPIQVKNISYTKSKKGHITIAMTGKFFDIEDPTFATHNLSVLSALNNVINETMHKSITVLDYRSSSRGSTVDAISISDVTLECDGHVQVGHAEDEDIELSALKAFIDAVNLTYVELNRI